MQPISPLITTLLLIISAALFGGVTAIPLKAPAVVGYIVGGFLISNSLGSLMDTRVVGAIAEVGITLLLFTLGIEFSLAKLRQVIRTMFWPIVTQILAVLFAVFVFLILLSVPVLPAIYIACAGALSSTAIIVKSLSDRGELDTVPGQMSLGWLVIQDIAVIPMVLLLGAVSQGQPGTGGVLGTGGSVLYAVAKSAIVLAIVLVFGRRAVPRLMQAVTVFRSREMLLLTTLGIVCLIGLFVFAAGIPLALGAFVAGMLMADTSQNHAVFAEVRPLRDIFAIIFFVSLGMGLPLGTLTSRLPFVVLITLFIVGAKTAVIMVLMRQLRYHRKTAFLTGTYLAPMSEMGFVLASAGIAYGVLGQEHAALLIAVTFISILLGAPLINLAPSLYYRLERFMGLPGATADPDMSYDQKNGVAMKDHAVICGYGRVGKYIGRALQMADIPFLVVDYNQSVLSELAGAGITTVYGDPADKDVLDFAQVDHARAVIIAIPDRHTQELVIANTLSLNRRIKIVCRTHHEQDQARLKSLGVHTVIQPEFEAALTVVNKLFADFGVTDEERVGKISRLKIEHGMG